MKRKGRAKAKRLLHVLCVSVTLGFLALAAFRFPNALGRMIEGFRDLGTSAAYYFCEMFRIPHGITPTVNSYPQIPFFDFPAAGIPAVPLPDTYDGFKSKWASYWAAWASPKNLSGYLAFIVRLIANTARAAVLLIPFILSAYILFKRGMKRGNNDYNKDTRPLRRFKKLLDKTYRPVRRFVSNFLSFVRKHKAYYKLWLAIWLFNFNLLTIGVEFIAFYLYFSASFDAANIYRQIYKLFLDLSVPLGFIPVWAWIAAGAGLFLHVRQKIAYARLRHFEMRNRGFINARPIVVMDCGTMGKRKTTMITDMALSQEAMFRDKAFEKILENDLKFPNFPWINLENDIKRAMARHEVYSLATIKTYIQRYRAYFAASLIDKPTFKSVRRHAKKRYGYAYGNMIYDYDYQRYGLTYDEKLKVVGVWEVIEIYAQLYFIYIIQSSLIMSNYSIRTDSLFSDTGNFPLWDTGFFKRDSRLIDSYSRHATYWILTLCGSASGSSRTISTRTRSSSAW
ncbi:MAG: hypothetical protein LBL66_08390 [Clostridiales bacterium]|nr:hypothetical protein [Clostridiales bacterium]